MHVIVLALCIGIVAGLRTVTPIAAMSWAARLGILKLGGTHLAFLGYAATPYIVTALALGELINDKRPTTPSRKVPPQFIGRIVCGSFSGAAIGLGAGMLVPGIVGGAIGAVIGTLGGAAARGRLATAIGKDLPAALIEDAVAIIASVAIVSQI